jgi:hypothetical protein
MGTKKWETFEKLVARVQEDLAPGVSVKLNQKLPGRNSETSRQVDILVQKMVGNYCVSIVIECKDHKRPVNVKQVEATIGLIKDVGANIGVIVASSGFTKAALTTGKNAGLKLYKLIDTDNHSWKVDVKIPSVCIVRNMKSFNFRIEYFSNGPIPVDHSYMLYDQQRQELGLAQDLLVDWWRNEGDQIGLGYHENVNFITSEVFLLIDNELVPVRFKANFQAEEIVYFRKWPLAKMSGFEDQINKNIETRGFTTSDFNLEDLKNNWEKVEDIRNLAIQPVITMHITICAQL